jgi:hypothetical protein
VVFDKSFYFEIRRVAAEWGRLEYRTTDALMTLASGDTPVRHQHLQLLVANMETKGQWDAIRVLLANPMIGDPDALAWFENWRKKADENLWDRRNKVVHGLWMANGNDPMPSAIALDTRRERKPKGLSMIEPLPMERADVAALAQEIADHHVSLSNWTGKQFRRVCPQVAEAGEHVATAEMTQTRFTIEPGS